MEIAETIDTRSATAAGDNGYETAFRDFIASYPDYTKTGLLDEIRRKEFSRLDAQDHVYLDYTGGALYAESQLTEHTELLRKGIFGNPHSSNPSSQAITDLVEKARHYVLSYFNASEDDYCLIFTQNCSGALKLLGEAYPFEQGDHFLLSFDNHNSVNGIREFARCKGAGFSYAPLHPDTLRLDEEELRKSLAKDIPGKNKLFAYPAQSNFSGVKHDLSWIGYAQKLGWDVLLDAAAYVPANRLDLGVHKPDFVTISFYKIFGYPTGIGALIAKKTALKKLRRPWFAGGTITSASAIGGWHRFAEDEAAYEDGTINYLCIPAVETGLRFIESIGIDTINTRISTLSSWLITELKKLRHSNGSPLIRLIGPDDTGMRGGTISMNFYDPDGKIWQFQDVEKLANAENISLRTGRFCNPGADETVSQLEANDSAPCVMESQPLDLMIPAPQPKSYGAVRVSVGLATNFRDIYRFMCFTKNFLNTKALSGLQTN